MISSIKKKSLRAPLSQELAKRKSNNPPRLKIKQITINR